MYSVEYFLSLFLLPLITIITNHKSQLAETIFTCCTEREVLNNLILYIYYILYNIYIILFFAPASFGWVGNLFSIIVICDL